MSRRLLGWLIPLSVGWYGGWKTARHLSEVEKLAEAAAPKPMARLSIILLAAVPAILDEIIAIRQQNM
uniref:Uncharacterized protein n=1 Tax=Oryza barthii TaxID=65489 RepID=A0A0D3G764_9ORYZ